MAINVAAPQPKVTIYSAHRLADAMESVRKASTDGPEFRSGVSRAIAENVPFDPMRPDQVGRDTAASAARHVSVEYLAHLARTYGRNSWDGAGGPLNIAVHVPHLNPGPSNDNPDALASHNLVGPLPGKAPLHVQVMHGTVENGRRVTGGQREGMLEHEINHLVWASELGDVPGPWARALNEAWADALAFQKDDDWVMSENQQLGVTGFRDLTKPEARHVSQLEAPPSNGDPGAWAHTAANTLNQPMVAFADRFGRNAMGRVWYDALTTHMDPARLTPESAAAATVHAAEARWGKDSPQGTFLASSWESIGVKPDLGA